MGRNLSLLASQPRFERDGVTHRRDCDCARCDAGYRPTEHERELAGRRWEEKKARQAAARALARRQEAEQLKRAEMDLFLDGQLKAASDQLRHLHQLEERLRSDQRLEELWRLRREGLSLEEAIAEVDRRFTSPPEGTSRE
jgi:hypothetical protein